MEDKNTYIEYLQGRVESLQDAYQRYKKAENETEADDMKLAMNSQAAMCLDIRVELERALEMYNITHQTETV